MDIGANAGDSSAAEQLGNDGRQAHQGAGHEQHQR
jgi:hypothetical protein